MRGSLENLVYNKILAMLPVGLIGFMLLKVLVEGFYADPPKNKLEAPNNLGHNLGNDWTTS